MCEQIHSGLQEGKIGTVLFGTSHWADPTFFPFRKTGEERVTSLSVGGYMSGKEEFQQEIPLPPLHEDWINASVIENQLTLMNRSWNKLLKILMHQVATNIKVNG